MQNAENSATADRFSRHFATYSREASVQKNCAERLAAAIRAELRGRPCGRVLELGCGTGLLTRELARGIEYRRLSLYDIVETCPSFIGEVPRADFTCADLDRVGSLPHADLVASSSCLQWLEDPARLFRTVRESLAAGGLFAATAFVRGNLREIGECGGSPLECPPAEEWRRMLESAGFAVRSFAAWEERLSFPSPLDAMRHLKRTGVLTPALGGYSDTMAFLRRYAALADPDGSVPLTYAPVLWIAS